MHLTCVECLRVFEWLTGVVGAHVFSFAAVLFAFGAQVGFDRTGCARLQDQAEDLLPRPQGDRLETTHGNLLSITVYENQCKQT